MSKEIRINKENIHYYFDPKIEPAAYSKVGDTVIFETKDCFNDQIKSDNDLVTSIDMSHINPCTGPLYIEDALPGSVVALKIESITLRNWGVLTLSPKEGVLDEYVKSPYTKIVKIYQKEGFIEFSKDIKVPLRPHIGTIGSTPLFRVPTGRTGNHGGNMDIRFIGAESIVYLPVFIKGGLIMMGDVHANMGDGEICIGVETGAEVKVRILNIYQTLTISSPVIETPQYWITYADAPDGKTGVKEVSKRMIEFLYPRTNLSMEELTLLISITGDVRIAQWAEAGYNYTFYLKMPKNIFEKKFDFKL